MKEEIIESRTITDGEVLEIRARAEKASIVLYDKIKDMNPYANIAAMDEKGNYLIPEYAEYVKYNTLLALLPATHDETIRYSVGLVNAGQEGK